MLYFSKNRFIEEVKFFFNNCSFTDYRVQCVINSVDKKARLSKITLAHLSNILALTMQVCKESTNVNHPAPY